MLHVVSSSFAIVAAHMRLALLFSFSGRAVFAAAFNSLSAVLCHARAELMASFDNIDRGFIQPTFSDLFCRTAVDLIDGCNFSLVMWCCLALVLEVCF